MQVLSNSLEMHLFSYEKIDTTAYGKMKDTACLLVHYVIGIKTRTGKKLALSEGNKIHLSPTLGQVQSFCTD